MPEKQCLQVHFNYQSLGLETTHKLSVEFAERVEFLLEVRNTNIFTRSSFSWLIIFKPGINKGYESGKCHQFSIQTE